MKYAKKLKPACMLIVIIILITALLSACVTGGFESNFESKTDNSGISAEDSSATESNYIMITDAKQLLNAASEYINEEKIIHLEGNIVLDDDVVFSQAVNIEICTSIEGEGNIVIKTISDDEIIIKVDAPFDFTKLVIDAPNCTLIIDSDDAPSLEYAALYFNAKAYNDNDLTIYDTGGEGQKRLNGLTMRAADNPGLEDDIVFTTDGMVLYAQIPFATNLNLVKNAKLESSSGIEFSPNTNGNVDLTKDLKCIVTDDNGKTFTYKIVTTRETFDLPIIYIETQKGIEITSKEEYIRASISVSAEGFTDITNASAQIRGRGHSTWKWEKKPYKIKFDKKTSLFGLEKAKDWVLLANYSDKSLIRNHLAMELAAELKGLGFTPHKVLADVFLNGSYIGVYSVGENVEVNKGRVEITEDNNVDTGYLLEVGGTDTTVDVLGVDFFHTPTVKFIKIVAPEKKVLSPEQFEFISNYFYKADEAIRTLSSYEAYIDVDSFIDWFIMYELSFNIDGCFRRSCFITKDAGGKLKMGPVWDFDLAFGNFSGDLGNYDRWASVGKDGEYVGVTWINYLIEDNAFLARLNQRWNEKKNILKQKATKTINAARQQLAQSQEANFKRWDILNKKAAYEPKDTIKYNTHELQLKYLEDFLKERFLWIDTHLK